MLYKRVCPICGAHFEHVRRVYCSDECSRKGYLLKIKESHDRKREEAKAKLRRKPSSITEVVLAAREAGMTYGQYVMEVMKNGDSRQW